MMPAWVIPAVYGTMIFTISAAVALFVLYASKSRQTKAQANRIRGIRYATSGDGLTVDLAGFYQVHTTVLLYRNGNAQMTSATTQHTIYCDAGDTIQPGTINDVMAEAIGRTHK